MRIRGRGTDDCGALQGGDTAKPEDEEFGEVLVEARKRKGLTLKLVAGRVLKDDGQAIGLVYLSDIELRREGPRSGAQ
jgi:hypothetical protein